MTLVKRLPPELVAVVETEQDPLRIRRLNLRELLRIARLSDQVHQSQASAELLTELRHHRQRSRSAERPHDKPP